MKKLFYLMSVAVALFGMTACDKNDVEEALPPVVEKSNFVLSADIATGSRTTLDGKKVDWAANDMLYLVTSDGVWGKPYSEDNAGTTIADYKYTEGVFVNSNTAALPDLEEGTEYTVYAMYTPGQRSYHRAASSTHLLAATQEQDCTNSTAHIAANDAMVGKFTVTPPATSASVSMTHLYTMMEVDVKNNTGAALTISKFEMEAANAELAGTFTVGFANTPIDITGSKNTTNKIVVNVANGAVAAGASLPIYFVMAPLSDYSGEVTFTVTDSNGYTYTKTVTLTNQSFEAGKYNKTSYAISEGVAPTDYSGTYAIVAERDGTLYYLSSADGSSENNRKAVNTGLAALGNDYRFPNAGMWKLEKVENTALYTLQSVATGAWLNKATDANNAKVTTNQTYAEQVNVVYDETTERYTIISSAVSTRNLALNSYSNSDYFAFYKGHINALQLIPCVPNFEMVVSDQSIDKDAKEGVVDVTLLYNEGWSISVSNNSGGWLTTDNALNSNNQVVYTAKANAGDQRSATVTLTGKKSGQADVVVSFAITQAAGNITLQKNITVFADNGYTNGQDVTSYTDGIVTMTFEKGSNNQNSPKYYDTGSGIRLYTGNTITIECEGKTIHSIEYVCSGSNYAGLTLADGQSGSLTLNTETYVWSGQTTSVKLSATKTNRIVQIRVYYVE